MFLLIFGHSRDTLPPVMFSVSPQCAVNLELLIHTVFVIMTDWLSAPVTYHDRADSEVTLMLLQLCVCVSS